VTPAHLARDAARTEVHNDARCPIVVLISGRGSNMRTLIEHSLERRSPYSVTRVFSDQAAAGGLGIARELGVPTEVCPAADFRGRAAFDAALAEAVARSAPTLIVLAGFMRILGAAFVARFAGRILNIHP
jgi:phosphoribosylglycinamide formyltransferase-1